MTNQKTIKIECEFCGGTGIIERFAHVEDGVCYGCKGKGYNMVTPAQAEKLQEAKKFDMVLLPASTNTYNDKEVIKSLGFKFKGSCGWVKIISVESVEEAKRISGEVGAEAKAKGLHGVFLLDINKLDNIQSPQHMQQVLRNAIKKELGN